MEVVEPIRKKTDLESMKRALRKRSLRDHALFVLGINSGLRISDLLKLRVHDVLVPGKRRPQITDRIRLREKKTGKTKDFPLNVPARSALGEYIRDTAADPDGPLFPSRKKDNDCRPQPISSVHAWKILSETAAEVGIAEKIGTHSMRKTFGYWAYKKGVDISHLQKLLNHASQAETLRYIGILRDDLDQIYQRVNL